MPKIGKNIRYRLSSDGTTLRISIKIDKKGELSKSGKSMVLASAGRAHFFDGKVDGEQLDGVGLSLNLFRMKAKKPKGAKVTNKLKADLKEAKKELRKARKAAKGRKGDTEVRALQKKVTKLEQDLGADSGSESSD